VTGLEEAARRFSDAERRRLMTAPGIGPAVIERLEAVGIHTLAHLQALGGEQAARRVGEHLQKPGWANRGRVLQRALVALPLAWTVGAGQLPGRPRAFEP
jgi:predicted flap endonuclease-1-like 5' DNA nuclease